MCGADHLQGSVKVAALAQQKARSDAVLALKQLMASFSHVPALLSSPGGAGDVAGAPPSTSSTSARSLPSSVYQTSPLSFLRMRLLSKIEDRLDQVEDCFREAEKAAAGPDPTDLDDLERIVNELQRYVCCHRWCDP